MEADDAENFSFIVVGGGIAGVTCAETVSRPNNFVGTSVLVGFKRNISKAIIILPSLKIKS